MFNGVSEELGKACYVPFSNIVYFILDTWEYEWVYKKTLRTKVLEIVRTVKWRHKNGICIKIN